MTRSPLPTDSSAEKILEIAEPTSGSGRFHVVTADKGITVFKQQMRALNLLYAIRETDRLKKGQNIGIVGAGAAGVTAAAAAFVLGYRVHLFEKSQLYCHLQQGCDTRWIHPHLYNWPDPGSERVYAGLPFLDWRASPAAEVVVQMTGELKRIVDRKSENFQFTWGVNVTFPSPKRIRWSGRYHGEEEFDAVIFAIGFGVERSIKGLDNKSYWRNDSLNQPKAGAVAGNKTTILVSGTGDGGLIELIRSTVNDYNQGRIIRELFDGEERLVDELRRLVKEWRETGRSSRNPTWLYDKYHDLFRNNCLKSLILRLRSRIRHDTTPILNGKADRFSMSLDLDSGSVLNTLLVFALEKSNAFEYRPGECQKIANGAAWIDGKKVPAHKFIIRHGPDIRKICKEAEFHEADVVLDRISPGAIDTSERLWPAGWWGNRGQIFLQKAPVEFVNPATVAIANTFVSTLSDVVKLKHRTRNPQFRIALHRIVRIGEEDYFQQISRYSGTRNAGLVGRVLGVNVGIVGLSCRLGGPVIVNYDGRFNELWERLEVLDSRARPIDDSVRSLLACPFFAPTGAGRTDSHISLVLFVDSAEKQFFSKEVLEIIYAASKGFVENVEDMKASKEITFTTSDFPGLRVQNSAKDRSIVREYAGVVTDSKVFRSFRKDLTFSSVESFDAELNHFGHKSVYQK